MFEFSRLKNIYLVLAKAYRVLFNRSPIFYKNYWLFYYDWLLQWSTFKVMCQKNIRIEKYEQRNYY